MEISPSLDLNKIQITLYLPQCVGSSPIDILINTGHTHATYMTVLNHLPLAFSYCRTTSIRDFVAYIKASKRTKALIVVVTFILNYIVQFINEVTVRYLNHENEPEYKPLLREFRATLYIYIYI